MKRVLDQAKMIPMGMAQEDSVDLWAGGEQTWIDRMTPRWIRSSRSGLRLLEAPSTIISDKGIPTSRIRRDVAVANSTQFPPISLLPR